MKRLIMKQFFEETPSSPPSDYSNDASTSRESRSDHQEMGSQKIPHGENVPVEARAVRRFPCCGDLNSLRVVIAEMVGTFILVFCVCGIVAITQLLRGEVGLMEYAATGGLAIIVVIYSIGSISGAHVNPSVTIAFAASGQFPWSRVPIYVSAQMVGSVLATFVEKSIYGIQSDSIFTTRPLHGCTAAFWVELVGTFIIMFLAASLSSQARAVGNTSGLVVGIAISLAVLITGPVSGGSMNPARSFGPAIVSWRFDDIWLYLTAPTVGAVAGALLFRVLRLQHKPCQVIDSTLNTQILVR